MSGGLLKRVQALEARQVGLGFGRTIHCLVRKGHEADDRESAITAAGLVEGPGDLTILRVIVSPRGEPMDGFTPIAVAITRATRFENNQRKSGHVR